MATKDGDSIGTPSNSLKNKANINQRSNQNSSANLNRFKSSDNQTALGPIQVIADESNEDESSI